MIDDEDEDDAAMPMMERDTLAQASTGVSRPAFGPRGLQENAIAHCTSNVDPIFHKKRSRNSVP